MNMTEKNGQPSMEEILASIRRIIAEEPVSHAHNGELRGTPIMLKGDSALEDAAEFDLPAIFRSSPPPPTERSTPLLGRLTDAIRSATTSASELRNGANGEDYAGHSAELGSGVTDGGLSSLKSPRPDSAPVEPLRPLNGIGHEVSAPSAYSTPSAPVAAASSSGPPEEPKRVMAPFKDTHFMRMATPAGGASAPAPSPSPAAAAPLPPEAGKPVDFGTIIPGQFDRASLASGQAATPQTFAAPEPTIAPPPHVAPVIMPPPPLPHADQNALVVVPPGGEETGSIEDTTADLLRPMLRQWLADNMPRMVEKALHIEIAESIKAPKKP
ncbi:DUF2497 domain-containing protein [uncultured Hyphomicrobium sp.]|uniref:DUF2497 domain-containing protein n=1 Tax=uncultured Hyphomicrobium sp. TaxID=194373 RepID=UPI0025F9B708|nr:DUF2497 domain-containing protein [uncultured Hyphomicrobium sp.]